MSSNGYPEEVRNVNKYKWVWKYLGEEQLNQDTAAYFDDITKQGWTRYYSYFHSFGTIIIFFYLFILLAIRIYNPMS
jgi:hypothetical protein